MPFDASGIYLITNKVNGKVYVGSAVRIKRRWIEHRTRFRANTHHNEHLQRAWNKYGEESFNFSIIQLCDKTELLKIETELISWFNSANEEFGYNICKEGRSALGRKLSEETKAKIGKGNKGKKLSEDHIESMRKAFTGKKRDPQLMLDIAARRKGQKRIRVPGTLEQQEHRRKVNTELANRRWAKYRNFELDKQIKI